MNFDLMYWLLICYMWCKLFGIHFALNSTKTKLIV